MLQQGSESIVLLEFVTVRDRQHGPQFEGVGLVHGS